MSSPKRNQHKLRRRKPRRLKKLENGASESKLTIRLQLPKSQEDSEDQKEMLTTLLDRIQPYIDEISDDASEGAAV